MGLTTASSKSLKILRHFHVVPTVSLYRWQHHSWF